jgi:glutamate dehydrogenase
MEEQQRSIRARVAYRWLLGLARVLERTTRWVLHNVDPERSPAEVVARSRERLDRLRRSFAELVSGDERGVFETRVREIRELGADEDFSRTLVSLRFLDQLLDIVDIAREAEVEEETAARSYYRVSEVFEIPWLRRSAFEAAGDDHWEQRSAQLLAEDLARAHRKLVMTVIRAREDDAAVEDAVQLVLAEQEREVERFRAVAEELRSAEGAGLAATSVVVRELSVISDRMEERSRAGLSA